MDTVDAAAVAQVEAGAQSRIEHMPCTETNSTAQALHWSTSIFLTMRQISKIGAAVPAPITVRTKVVGKKFDL